MSQQTHGLYMSPHLHTLCHPWLPPQQESWWLQKRGWQSQSLHFSIVLPIRCAYYLQRSLVQCSTRKPEASITDIPHYTTNNLHAIILCFSLPPQSSTILPPTRDPMAPLGLGLFPPGMLRCNCLQLKTTGNWFFLPLGLQPLNYFFKEASFRSCSFVYH